MKTSPRTPPQSVAKSWMRSVTRKARVRDGHERTEASGLVEAVEGLGQLGLGLEHAGSGCWASCASGVAMDTLSIGDRAPDRDLYWPS